MTELSWSYNGECVTREACPAIQRAPPVWIDVGDYDLRLSWHTILREAGDGYCCPNQGMSACSDAPGSGCYLALQSIDTTIPPPMKEWCKYDNDCVLDPDSESDLEFCDSSNICDQELKVIRVDETVFICDGADEEEPSRECYTTMPDTCLPYNAINCIAETHTVCRGTGGTSVVCSTNGFSCEKTYDNVICEEITSYHGAECRIWGGCKTSTCIEQTKVKLPSEGSAEIEPGSGYVPDTSSCSPGGTIKGHSLQS
jgi:hypothetical protein